MQRVAKFDQDRDPHLPGLRAKGTFSNDSKREATRDGAPAIDLIDGDPLCDLLKQLKLGVQGQMVENVTVDAAWFSNLYNRFQT